MQTVRETLFAKDHAVCTHSVAGSSVRDAIGGAHKVQRGPPPLEERGPCRQALVQQVVEYHFRCPAQWGKLLWTAATLTRIAEELRIHVPERRLPAWGGQRGKALEASLQRIATLAWKLRPS